MSDSKEQLSSSVPDVQELHVGASQADPITRIDHLQFDIGGRATRGGALLIGTQGLKFLINIGATVVLARLLSPRDYGLLGMVLVVTGFVALFKNLGLSAVTIQRADLTLAQLSNLFWINSALGVVTMLLTIIAGPFVALFYNEPRLTGITAALSGVFLFGGISVQHDALLKRQMRFLAIATIDICSVVAGLLFAISLAWYGAGYWALVINQLIVSAAFAIGVWSVCQWRPGWLKRGEGVRSMLVFGKHLTGHHFFNYFARNLDNLLIGRFWGPVQLGLYAKAYQLLMLPIEQTTVPIDGVAVSTLSKLADTPARYRSAYLRIIEKVAMVTMPGVALMIATSDWLVGIVLGDQWLATARIFAWLGVFGLIEPVANTLGWLLISQGRSLHMFRLGLINGVITIVSILIGLKWGAVGVAASYSLIGFFVRMPIIFWWVGRTGPVSSTDIYRNLAPSFAASMGVIAAVYGLRTYIAFSNPVVGVLFASLTALITTLVVFLLIPKGRSGLADSKSLLGVLVMGRTILNRSL